MAAVPNQVKLLVTGSRSITDKQRVWTLLDQVRPRPDLLIHGGAKGVDTLAGAWAKEHQVPVKVVRPNFKAWPVNKYRWRAYTVRDYDMVDMATHVVAIWDGKSSGTRITMEYAQRPEKKDKVVTIHVCQ